MRNKRANETSSSENSLVIHEDIRAFDVSVEEVFTVAVGKALQELKHNASDVFLGEIHHSRLQQTHKIVIHVFKDEVKRAAVLLQS